MIDKREILHLARQTSLTPHVIEKDYVLGWMLAGIYAHEELANSWIFKGGTCLKKCFFETYRFSEDLDFTLREDQWVAIGAALAKSDACLRWWIADWWVYGDHRYGDRKKLAAISIRGVFKSRAERRSAAPTDKLALCGPRQHSTTGCSLTARGQT